MPRSVQSFKAKGLPENGARMRRRNSTQKAAHLSIQVQFFRLNGHRGPLLLTIQSLVSGFNASVATLRQMYERLGLFSL